MHGTTIPKGHEVPYVIDKNTNQTVMKMKALLIRIVL